MTLGSRSSSDSTISCSLTEIGADLSSTGRTIPSVSPSKAASRCSGIDLRIAALGGQLLRRRNRLLGLDRQFVESKCHGRILHALSWHVAVTTRHVADGREWAAVVHPSWFVKDGKLLSSRHGGHK